MLYRLARFLLRVLLRISFRWEIRGARNVPAEGPVILAGNHFAWWDPPVMGCSVDRPVSFMTKEEYFHTPVMGPLVRRVGAFPVKRHTADRAALRQALDILRTGGVLGIFPEGTRSKSGQLQRPEPGLAWIAYKSGAPVVPLAIVSTYRFRAPLRVVIGEPVRLWEVPAKRADAAALEEASRRLMTIIARLKSQAEEEG